MKPTHNTPRFTKKNSLAAAILHFQADHGTSLGHGLQTRGRGQIHFNAGEFLALSGDFFRGETKRSFAIEATLFAWIVALSAWPIVLMASAIAKWIK